MSPAARGEVANRTILERGVGGGVGVGMGVGRRGWSWGEGGCVWVWVWWLGLGLGLGFGVWGLGVVWGWGLERGFLHWSCCEAGSTTPSLHRCSALISRPNKLAVA